MAYWDKRGVSIPGIIMILLSFLVLVVVGVNMFGALPNNDDGEACYVLMGAKKVESTFLGDSINVIQKNCPTIQTTLPGDKKATHQDQVMKAFADKIERAWFIVHEGSITAMWDTNMLGAFGTLTGDCQKCIITYAINYDGKMTEPYVISKGDFTNFLTTQPAFETDGIQWTYLDYIQSFGPDPSHLYLVSKKENPEDEEELLGQNKQFLIPGKRYAIAIAEGTQACNYFACSLAGPDEVCSSSETIMFFGDYDTIENMGCETITAPVKTKQ